MTHAAIESAGLTRLNDRVESDHLLAGVAGPKVIAVDYEAVRSSLSLARRGCSITAVGSSPSSLDALRELTEEAPVEPKLGDAHRLPAGDEAYDSLLSLDLVRPSLDWPGTLVEWARVVRPGGRLVFDVPVLACGDLVAEADRQGLVVVDVVPYGAFLAGGDVGHALPVAGKFWWGRLLSWLATDDRLFEFALFLEQELVARLVGAVTGRHLAVLERRRDPRQNEMWLRARDDVSDLTAREITLVSLGPHLRISTAEFTSRLNAHVRVSLRNFTFLHGLCQGLALSDIRVDLASFLETDVMARLEDWSQRLRLDRNVTSQARGWLTAPAAGKSMRLYGVSLGDALEYYLVEDLLTQGYGHFSGIRS